MKPTALLIAAVSYLAGGALTFLIIRAFSVGSPELSFIVGAVLGSQVGAIMHHRQPGSQPTATAKSVLGVVLAICAIALGVFMHLTSNPFKFAEVSVPLAAIGSFVFPFVLFDTMGKALVKQQDSNSKPTDGNGRGPV